MDSEDSRSQPPDVDLTRRELLKLTAAAGSAMAAGPLLPWIDATAAAQDAQPPAVPIDVLLREWNRA